MQIASKQNKKPMDSDKFDWNYKTCGISRLYETQQWSNSEVKNSIMKRKSNQRHTSLTHFIKYIMLNISFASIGINTYSISMNPRNLWQFRITHNFDIYYGS